MEFFIFLVAFISGFILSQSLNSLAKERILKKMKSDVEDARQRLAIAEKVLEENFVLSSKFNKIVEKTMNDIFSLNTAENKADNKPKDNKTKDGTTAQILPFMKKSEYYKLENIEK